jgi:hypothetical protein
MSDEQKSPSEQALDLQASWNPPPTDNALERLVGVPTEPGDTRATAHVPMEVLNKSFTGSGVDASRPDLYRDDADDAGNGEVSEDMSKEELQKEAEKRDLSKSGNKKELVERIQEYDAQQGAGDEDDDDEDDDDEE